MTLHFNMYLEKSLLCVEGYLVNLFGVSFSRILVLLSSLDLNCYISPGMRPRLSFLSYAHSIRNRYLDHKRLANVTKCVSKHLWAGITDFKFVISLFTFLLSINISYTYCYCSEIFTLVRPYASIVLVFLASCYLCDNISDPVTLNWQTKVFSTTCIYHIHKNWTFCSAVRILTFEFNFSRA